MPRRMSFAIISIGVVSFIAWTALGDRPALSQYIDPCYKTCFVLGNRGGVSAQECNRRCRASKHYVCDDRCFDRYPNSPRELKSCRSKCVGRAGPY